MRKPAHLAAGIAAGAAALALAGVPTVASAATSDDAGLSDNPTALWGMNEMPGSNVMHDLTGHGYDGVVGPLVTTGLPALLSRGYAFPPAGGNFQPGRLAVVPDLGGRLNPGAGPVTLTVRLRTTANDDNNVAQKGQSGTDAGMFKMELDGGAARCTFTGNDGSAHVELGSGLADGDWHDITCNRDGSTVTITVDGRSAATSAPSGYIANGYPFVVGGKLLCSPPDVDCDYFTGIIGRVALSVG